MPSSKRSSHRSSSHSRSRSRSRRAPTFAERLAALQQQLQPALEMRWLKRRLRRHRHNKRRQQPARPSPQWQALRKALQFSWLKRRWRRQQRLQQQRPAWSPLSMLWPRPLEGLATRDAAALLLRQGSRALLILIGITIVLNALPLRLTGPQWYLGVLLNLAENVPVLILASAFSLLSLFVASPNAAANTYRSTLLRFSRRLYILAALLIPLQLGFTGWLYGQAFSENRTQLSAIRADANALIAGAQQTSNAEEFMAYLATRNMTGNQDAIAAAPIQEVQAEFIANVQQNQTQREQGLAAAFRSTLLRYTVNATKLFVSLLVLATFLRGFFAITKRATLPRTTAEAVPVQAATTEPTTAKIADEDDATVTHSADGPSPLPVAPVQSG